MDRLKVCGLEHVESVAVIHGVDMVMILFLRRNAIVKKTESKFNSKKNTKIFLQSIYFILL